MIAIYIIPFKFSFCFSVPLHPSFIASPLGSCPNDIECCGFPSTKISKFHLPGCERNIASLLSAHLMLNVNATSGIKDCILFY